MAIRRGRWVGVLLLAMSPGYGQSTAPQPGFPGGGMWKAPPHRAVPIELEDGVIVAYGGVKRTPLDEGSAIRRRFVVDSAATLTVVSRADVGWIGETGTAGGRLPDRSLLLGGAEVDHRPFFVMDMDRLDRQIGDRIDGIAGSDIFLNFAVRVDYVHRWMMLEVPESCATPEKKLAVKLVGGLPFVQASVSMADGKPVQGLFLLDTGQPGAGLVLTSEFLGQHPELTAKQAVAHQPAFDSQGAARDAEFLRLGVLELGAYAVKGPVAAVAAPSGRGDSGLAGVIGAGVLSRFDLIVDLPRRWVTLKPNAQFSDPFEADMSGILLLSGEANGRSGELGSRAGERVYTIAGIAEKSPASEAGLQQDDRLLTVGDRKVTDMSMDQIRGMLKSGPGTKLMVGVDRSGKKFQVVLTLRRAI